MTIMVGTILTKVFVRNIYLRVKIKLFLFLFCKIYIYKVFSKENTKP